jgi:DNA-directed RNA polymerase III subunit RPC7
MSFRGRGRGGRGRGGGFGYDHPAKHVPHEDFPVSLRSPSARSSRLLVYNSCADSNSFGDSFGWLITAYEQDITLPEMTCAKASDEEKALLLSTLKLEEFWRTSCYHLEEDAPKKSIVTELVTAYLFVHQGVVKGLKV